MTELKTLKDLDTAKDYTPLSRTHYEDFIDKEELKQEAIKWLLHGLKKRKNMFKMFMEFHNITEEDLK